MVGRGAKGRGLVISRGLWGGAWRRGWRLTGEACEWGGVRVPDKRTVHEAAVAQQASPELDAHDAEDEEDKEAEQKDIAKHGQSVQQQRDQDAHACRRQGHLHRALPGPLPLPLSVSRDLPSGPLSVLRGWKVVRTPSEQQPWSPGKTRGRNGILLLLVWLLSGYRVMGARDPVRAA